MSARKELAFVLSIDMQTSSKKIKSALYLSKTSARFFGFLLLKFQWLRKVRKFKM